MSEAASDQPAGELGREVGFAVDEEVRLWRRKPSQVSGSFELLSAPPFFVASSAAVLFV
jgi:hypothetical protein